MLLNVNLEAKLFAEDSFKSWFVVHFWRVIYEPISHIGAYGMWDWVNIDYYGS